MTSIEFRTEKEVQHAKRQDRYSQVARGNPYEGDDPAFPIHEYFQNKLLGDIRMLELNAGSALVSQLVVDTVTRLTIDDAELQEWAEEIELTEILEEAATDMYANGYMVTQYVNDSVPTAITINPCYWYPNLPALTHQAITSGRVIIPFTEYKKTKNYYAYVEKHEQDYYTRTLYKLSGPEDTNGTPVSLGTVSRLANLEPRVEVDFSLSQFNRRRSSRSFFGTSILDPIWQQLQEVNEIKTQLRQERIKHFKAKLAGPIESFQRSTRGEEELKTSKQVERAEANRRYSMSQDVFPYPAGSNPPSYIQRDLSSIDKGLAMVDKIISEVCATTGFPRSVFNLDEKGQIHVATEEKKDARYMRHVLRGQAKIIAAVRFLCEKRKPSFTGEITLESPFDMSKSEQTKLLREQNPTGAFVSNRRAIELLHPEMDKEEREEMIQEIEAENSLPEGFDRSAVDLNT